MKCNSAFAVAAVMVEQDVERGSVFHVVSVSPPANRGLHGTKKKNFHPIYSTRSEAQKEKDSKSKKSKKRRRGQDLNLRGRNHMISIVSEDDSSHTH